MLQILICNLSMPCPCLCLRRNSSSVSESGLVTRFNLDRAECITSRTRLYLRYNVAGASTCRMRRMLMSAKWGGLSYRQLADLVDFGILSVGFKMRQHISEAALSVFGQSRMRYSKTVSLPTERVCRCWADRKGPMYVMEPWLGYIAYP